MHAALSEHEKLTLSYISHGMTELEIAHLEHRSPMQIAQEMQGLRRQLRAKTNAHAVRIALTGLLID